VTDWGGISAESLQHLFQPHPISVVQHGIFSSCPSGILALLYLLGDFAAACFTMDSLPKIEDPCHRELDVPLFVKEGQRYTGSGVDDFLTFPSQQGFDLQKLKFGDFGGQTFEDAVSFVQEWGFFAMITEVLRQGNMNIRFDFSPGGESHNTVSNISKNLPDLIRIWHENGRQLDATTKEARATNVYRITRAVADLIADIGHQEFRGPSSSSSKNILPDDEELLGVRDLSDDHHHDDQHEFGLIVTDKYYERNRNFFTDEKDWEEERFKIGEIEWNLGRVGSKAHQLMLSIIIMGEALTNAASAIYDSFTKFSWPSSPIISIFMEVGGWCPFQIAQLRRHCSNSRLYYLSFFDRTQFSKSHRRCCQYYCLAYHVEEKTYQTGHVNEGCDCAFVSFEEQHSEVATWIELGQTALVLRDHHDPGNRETTKGWRLVPSRANDSLVRYVCISHVWGDGMGNPRENALPGCQLAKIQEAVNGVCKSPTDVPFWIDTICIPLQQPMRRSSIRVIPKIFEEAEHVLVLDNTLLNVNAEASVEEIMTRIDVSGWMQRLWTLSEGVAASELYFQLRQRAVTIGQLQWEYREKRLQADLDRLQTLAARGPGNPLVAVLHRQLTETCEKFAARSMSDVEQVNLQLNEIYYSVTQSLGYIRLPKRVPADSLSPDYLFHWMLLLVMSRSISKEEDEPICLAYLLRLDSRTVLDMPPEERMLSFLLTHQHLIPSGILFGQKPKMKRPGCRWVPRSLTQPDFNWSGKVEELSEQGIVAFYPALSLRKSEYPGLGIHFGLIDCSTGMRYLVDIHNIAEDAMVVLHDTLHVIVEKVLDGRDTTKGVLVNVVGEEDGCSVADYVAAISIRNVGERKPLPDHECISADPISPDRLWRIG